MTRRAARATAAAALVLGCGTWVAPGVATDDTNLRLVYATFTGTGTVTPMDNGPLKVTVTAGTTQCTAFVVVGVTVPTAARCTFALSTPVSPVGGIYCSGEATATGYLVVYYPDAHTHEFSYTMRVVVDEVSVHGFGGSSVGAVSTGYAEFSYAGTTCQRSAPAYGVVEY